MLRGVAEELRMLLEAQGGDSVALGEAEVDDDDIYISAERDGEEGPCRVTVCVRDRDGGTDWRNEPLLKLEVRPSPVLPSILKRLMSDIGM